MSVSAALFRVYRPLLLIFSGLILATELVGVTIGVVNGRMNYSWWLVFTRPAFHYWLLVVGIVLVAMQLKQFMSNGRTRHEFVAGAARFVLTLSVGFAAAAALGHGLESLLVGAFDKRSPTYPVATVGQIISDFGHTLPGTLAYPLSGALIALGFYRYKPWVGVIVMVLGALPAVAADFFLHIDGKSNVTHRGPYAVALLASLAVTVVAAAAFQRLMSDVPVRRTAG
jgi:hypothetical protein